VGLHLYVSNLYGSQVFLILYLAHSLYVLGDGPIDYFLGSISSPVKMSSFLPQFVALLMSDCIPLLNTFSVINSVS
jgi:hypothetical protein